MEGVEGSSKSVVPTPNHKRWRRPTSSDKTIKYPLRPPCYFTADPTPPAASYGPREKGEHWERAEEKGEL